MNDKNVNALNSEDDESFESLSKSMQESSKVIAEQITQFSTIMQGIVKIIVDLTPKIEFPKIDPEVTEHINFVMVLRKLKWPLFLEYDKNLQKQIIELYAEKGNDHLHAEKINAVIFNYCDDKFIKKTFDFWAKCGQVSELRLPILREALDMHLAERYYASTALLMCQLYGVVIEISHFAQENSIIISNENKRKIARHYKMDDKLIDTEKGKFIQLSTLPNNGVLLWEATAEYIQNEILCSSDSKIRWSQQPLRNKICHGEQLNFGTKEHSLKAILCIDILMKLSNEVYELSKIVGESDSNI